MKKIIIEERKNFSIINIIITLVVALILFFLFLPALNMQSLGFWVYIVSVLGIYTLLQTITNIDSKGNLIRSVKLVTGLTATIGIVIIGVLITNFIFSPFFMSKTYSERIKVDKNSDFLKDVPQVDFDKLPLLDKDSSSKLGDRVMGQLPELVSQFYVSELYTQINYNDQIVRVTPLEYNGIFKYLSNYKDGIKGYITVNSVNGNSKLVKLDKGMKYMPSAILMQNLKRKARFEYPTKIFGEIAFELDNEGNPFWIIPTLKYKGVEVLEEVEGVIILNPINGDSKFYKVKDVPRWVDHVYSASMIINQLDDWGVYSDGFFNSIFGQKNVVRTTEGYNYTVMNDDVYLYTGITSVSSDEANLGFVLSNMRTKETKFYSVPGAEEFSAMSSAKGQVQQMNYSSTFPLLINLNNKPTYLVSLKDKGGLVKMYGFVDVVDYQKVVVTDASKGIKAAAQAYLGEDDIAVDENKLITKDITVSYINSAIIGGNTFYYIIDNEGKRYQTSIKTNKKVLPFIKSGDVINVSFIEDENVSEISKIK